MPTPDWWLDDLDVEVVQGGFDLVFGESGDIDVDVELYEYIVEVATEGLQGNPGPTGNRGPAGTQPVFSLSWDLEVMAGHSRYYFEVPGTVTNVRVAVDQSPVGADVVIDVNKNGTTIFTTQADRPRITPGQFTDLAVPDVTAVDAGDYMTVDIDQVGSATPGSWLTVTVTMA